MKKISPKGMKILKTVHLLSSMMWVVGVISMGVAGVISPGSGDELHMMLSVNRHIDDILVIPGAIITLITGLIYGVCTNWGFFKHTWITVKWIAAMAVTIAGTFYFNVKMERCVEITALSRDTALTNPELLGNMQITLTGTCFQAAVLVALVVISVFKPWKKKVICL